MATIKATVYIHGGDYDCSEAVRMCYRAVGVLPYGSFMWTGNEVALLKEHGFVERSLNSPQTGDVLWKQGHTEMYLGDNTQGGARIAETGDINGTKGDQTGGETARSAYKPSSWSKLLRYEGGATIDGIPCAIAAAQVMDHIIDHGAHGYSQPNRSGDGTIEKVTISWVNDESPVRPIASTFRLTVTTETNVRSAPDTGKSNVTGTLLPGTRKTCDGWLVANGSVWASFLEDSGRRRYVSVGKANSWVVVS